MRKCPHGPGTAVSDTVIVTLDRYVRGQVGPGDTRGTPCEAHDCLITAVRLKPGQGNAESKS